MPHLMAEYVFREIFLKASQFSAKHALNLVDR